MTNVNYKVLKSNIIKACTQKNAGSMDFYINMDKLSKLTDDINLVPIRIGQEAKKVKPELIPYLSEYFEKSRLSWFSETKYSTIICFIDKNAIDEKAQDLLDKIAKKQVDDPDLDKVKLVATIVADYPCYFANIISYQNNDPRRMRKPTYEIVCRANKVVIKSSDYQYNPKDFS